MASPAKRGRTEPELVSKVGFLHNISPIKSNTTGSINYFTATLQVDHDNFQRVVSFSTHHHGLFTDAEKKRSPVKLANCLLTASQHQDSTHDIKFNTRSHISFTEGVDFNCRQPLLATEEVLASKDVSLKEFLTLGTMQKGNLKAKVLNIIVEEEIVDTKYGQRKMKKILVGDQTATLSCCLWEDKRSLVKTGLSYAFTNMCLKHFKGTQYGSTSHSSNIMPIEDIEVDEEAISDVIVGSIEGVEVTRVTKCPSCFTVLTATSAQKTIKCNSCRKRCITTHLHVDMKTNMKIVHDGVSKEVFVPCVILTSLLDKIGCKSTDTDTIEEQLLVYGPYKFTLHQMEVLNIELCQRDPSK